MKSLDSFFKKEKKPHVKLTKQEVEEQLRRAWWDLFISNLPKPVIVDTEQDKKETPEIFKEGVPSGFSIDPDTWICYFNCNDIPDFAKKEEAKQYCRSIGHHENTHFTVCPGSKRMDVRLVDSALKGFSYNLKDKQNTASAAAHLVENIFGDWIGDSLLGVEKYGREDFTDLTRWRMKKTIENVAEKTKNYSPLWKVLVGTYEQLFQEDLGLSKYTKLNSNEKGIIEECIKIIGNDFKDKSTWPKKVKKLATKLEGIIIESCKDNKGRGKGKGGYGQQKGLSLPDDVEKQMGPRPTESQIKPISKSEADYKNEKEKEIDEEILNEILKLNRKDPGQFAGTLGAFISLEPNEAIRLMYRARAREYLIKITEKIDRGTYGAPSSYTNWDVGDPILGRGGLEIVPSMMSSGVLIPGITTIKRKREVSDLPGRLKQIADLSIIIDSSGSMNWSPMSNDENNRGSFDKAIIAAEAATLYALDHGAKVSVINFSGTGKVKHQNFTRDLDKLEKNIIFHYNGGTDFPVNIFENLMKKNKNKIVNCAISDFDVSNNYNTSNIIKKYTNKNNPTYLFDIGNRSNLAKELEKHEGITRFKILKMNDLKDIVIGRLKKDYEK